MKDKKVFDDLQTRYEAGELTKAERDIRWSYYAEGRAQGFEEAQPKARLKKNGMCATPVDMDALTEYIGLFNGPEAIVAFTVSGMTWNLACELTKPEKEEEE